MNDPGHQRPATLPALIAAFTALNDAGPVDRARAIPDLIEAAKGVLSDERAAAMAEAVGGGMNQAELARQLGITRQQISKTLAGLQISVLTRRDDGTWHLAGSFEYRNAERFRSDGPEDLYRTIEGRWVLHAAASTANERIMAYTYVTDDQARAWLRENGHEQALHRFAS